MNNLKLDCIKKTFNDKYDIFKNDNKNCEMEIIIYQLREENFVIDIWHKINDNFQFKKELCFIFDYDFINNKIYYEYKNDYLIKNLEYTKNLDDIFNQIEKKYLK